MKKRLLVVYSGIQSYVSTTQEYLNSFARYSKYDVQYLHVTHGADVSDVNFNGFDAVINSYCARLCYPGYVSQSYIEALKNFRGARVLAVQDEYNRTNLLRQAIRDLEFTAVLTCVPQASLEFVYPKAMFPNTEFVTVLTGYVPSGLINRRSDWPPLAHRPIVIGYRGRDIGGLYGRLGSDKFEIGRRMRQICEERGIAHDIETAEDKRIYGDAWYDFLGSCRATLGTESGSNVFDFDGKLEATYKELKELAGREIRYEEFHQYTDPLEGLIHMGQISPRVFEAAVTRTPMILFTGQYSGAISPGDHYIELKKDFSNIESVLSQIDDIDFIENLAERAYDHLIGSGNYRYRVFVETVEQVIDRALDRNRIERPILPLAVRTERTPTTLELIKIEKEWPTATPRDHLFFYCREYYRESQSLQREFYSETSRLNEALEYLQGEFARETSRLNKELEYLQGEFARETGRLMGLPELRARRLIKRVAQTIMRGMPGLRRLR